MTCLTCIFWERNKQDGIVGLCANPPESDGAMPEYRFQFETCNCYDLDSEREIYVDAGFMVELKNARKAMQLTQNDTALWFGIKTSRISDWETGRGTPDDEMMGRINKFIQLVNLPLFTE